LFALIAAERPRNQWIQQKKHFDERKTPMKPLRKFAAVPVALAKKKRKKCRFHGTDHWISKEQLAAICAASPPLYAALWRLMAAHALRISEALSLCAGDVDCGFLTIKRLKGSQKTTQPLLVDLSAQIASGTYRLFPVHEVLRFCIFAQRPEKLGCIPTFDIRTCYGIRA
jgi:integrase